MVAVLAAAVRARAGERAELLRQDLITPLCAESLGCFELEVCVAGLSLARSSNMQRRMQRVNACRCTPSVEQAGGPAMPGQAGLVKSSRRLRTEPPASVLESATRTMVQSRLEVALRRVGTFEFAQLGQAAAAAGGTRPGPGGTRRTPRT